MNTPKSIEKSLQNQHLRVMDRVKNTTPVKKWVIVWGHIGLQLVSLISLVLSGGFISWFINNLINNKALLQPSLIDISGVEWVWSPELFGLAIFFYFVGVSIQKPFSEQSLKFAGFGAVSVFAILLNLVLLTPTTQAFQSNLQPQFNQLGYRVFSRDMHVKALMDHGTYYGIVAYQNNGIIKIDHGGIVKSFNTRVNFSNQIAKPIQIEFSTQNGILVVDSMHDLTK
jgi:hypothetical protein